MNRQLLLDLEPVFQATLAKWGEEAQYDQAVEECAELIAALKHFKRRRIGPEHLIEELADVTLMVGQLSWMLGSDRVADAIERKLAKLHGLLTEAGEGEPGAAR
jgi:NTP pyrophosphatase (non-canonical NTP hydrolase)